MPDYADLAVSHDGFVATVEIQRPPHNFFDRSLITAIADAFDNLDENPDCRAIVLAAQGKSFCAGANFGSGQNNDDSASGDFTEEGFKNTTGILYREAVRLFASKKPIVAAIQGAAIGGGFGLALVADFRVAAPEARFAANFVKLGIHQGFGLSTTLPRLIGQQQANLLLLTGRRISGEQAHKIGLVDVLTDLTTLRAQAQSMAQEIAENAPLAVVSVRATMRAGLAQAVAKATEHELKEQQWLRGTEDATEGIRSVGERRPGNFKGK
ncbi:MAG: enoyl-CoA hydratase/isomerase family protein [Proteobacteria bacterium]|nr:enoyl-CoA hydratase/isomerase family protein [Pseudomonadota bacterium]